jgi:hypothetical protein
VFAALLTAFSVMSQTRKVQNQPYADHKLYHFGFHVGLHAQDLLLTNNGLADENGIVRFAEIPDYSPGFSVGVIGDLFLNPYMNLRLTPTLHFGDKTLRYVFSDNREPKDISVRSNYLSMPLELKISSMRNNNMRPYIIGGLYGDLDLGRKRGAEILLGQMDYGFEFGFGCTFYMPFFRFSPELKFKFGLTNILEHNREDLTNDADKIFANSISKATARMVVLVFNFE